MVSEDLVDHPSKGIHDANCHAYSISSSKDRVKLQSVNQVLDAFKTGILDPNCSACMYYLHYFYSKAKYIQQVI